MSTRNRNVLISGASIAGPALAFWLNRYGFRTTIVERSPELRLGGQNVDIQGAGREVIRRMGLEDEVSAARTPEKGLRFVDANDVVKAEFPAGTSDSAAFTQEVEILRGDLAKILYDRTCRSTEYVFGDQIVELHDEGSKVCVGFKHGAERDFDVVVAADGIRSTTRTLIVDDEPVIRALGLNSAYFTIPRAASDSDWARWYHAPGGRSIFLRPDNQGTIRASLWFTSPARGYETLAAAEQKEVAIKAFSDAGWEAPRVLDGLTNANDAYFDAIGQVIAPRWSNGRAVLVGDAAYCPSPVTGMGTTLSIVGAYILAGELGRHAELHDAFTAYEEIMRPFAEASQKLPPGVPQVAHPKTRLGVGVLHTVLRIVSSSLFVRAEGGLRSPAADKIELPDY